jgi:hypothetical protein
VRDDTAFIQDFDYFAFPPTSQHTPNRLRRSRFFHPVHPDRFRRYYWLLPAEGHLTRRLFGNLVRRIAALPVPTG